MATKINLSTIFQTVTERLTKQKDSLNTADTYNHDHGDHMVQIFDLIQTAVSKKSDKPISNQLEYASEEVTKKADSGSGKLYAQGLLHAAQDLSGSKLDAGGISTLVKDLLNVEEPEPAQQESNVLGSLLSGFMGTSEEKSEDSAFGVDDLLQVGMAFFQSKQEGDSNQEAIMEALLAASPLGQSSHRSQSGSLVASTIMSFAKSLSNK